MKKLKYKEIDPEKKKQKKPKFDTKFDPYRKNKKFFLQTKLDV